MALTPACPASGGRTDLLAEVAGILEGTSEGQMDEPLARQAAALCRQAGADPEPIRDQLAAVQFRVVIAIGVFRAGQPAARNSPSTASSASRSASATIWCTREGDSPIAVASVRIEIPSARADANAQLRSRSACSSRHAARETRASTRRSRRHVAVRSAIFMRTACPACTVQQSGHDGGSDDAVLTGTPFRAYLGCTRYRSPRP